MKKLGLSLQLATICLFAFVAVGSTGRLNDYPYPGAGSRPNGRPPSTSGGLHDYPYPNDDIDPLFNMNNWPNRGRPSGRPRPPRRRRPSYTAWDSSNALRARSDDLRALQDLIGGDSMEGRVDAGFPSSRAFPTSDEIDPEVNRVLRPPRGNYIDPGFNRPNAGNGRPSYPWWWIFG
ncbi:unnamed protein product [Orchesella dallaii]|uniref:Uncharacterized protein n=1 Tax=Orchesella dallaii TaxID=48710 RepID=A0ABP1PMD3_9HEXA